MKDLVGILMPFVIDFVNKHVQDSKWRFVVAFASCIVIALVLNLDMVADGNWSTLLAKVGIIFTEAQVTYKLYWEKSEVREAIFDTNKA